MPPFEEDITLHMSVTLSKVKVIEVKCAKNGSDQ